MLHQTFLFLGQLWQLFEVSQILEFLRYVGGISLRALESSDDSCTCARFFYLKIALNI